MKRGPGKRNRAEILHDLFTSTGIVPASSLVGQPPTRSPLDIKADRRRAAKNQAPTDAIAAEYDGVEPADWLEKPAKELHLREYQRDAEDSIFREWQDVRSTLLVMATGLGKTVCASRVCQRILNGELGELGRRFLFLAHREELITQTFETFRAAFPRHRVEIDRAGDRASRLADIVVASNQTLGRRDRLERWDRDSFAAICQDEAHHAIASNATYNGIIRYFATAKLLGLSVGPGSIVEMRGGCYGKGFVGSIEYAFTVAEKSGLPVRLHGDLEIIDFNGVESRGWDGRQFLWKGCRRIIRHPCDCPAWSVTFRGGRRLVTTADHSIYRAVGRRGAVPVVDCPPADQLRRGDVLLSDAGGSWGGGDDATIDMVAFCSAHMPHSRVHIQCDVRSISRAALVQIGVSDPRAIHARRVRGSLPLREYVALGDAAPVAARLIIEGSKSTIAPRVRLSEWAYFLGFWLGDGWLGSGGSAGRVCLAVESAGADRMASVCRQLVGVGWSVTTKNMPGASVEIRACNAFVAELIRRAVGSVKCWSKKIPGEWIVSWPESARRELLRGLIDSDGNRSARSGDRLRHSFITTSRGLCQTVLSLLRSVGVVGSMTVRQPRAGGVVRGRAIAARRPAYHVNWSGWSEAGDSRRRRGHRSRFDHGDMEFVESHVRRSGDEELRGYVYDLEMEGHPSFVANGILVHNTATPDRQDEIALGQIFDSVAFTFDIVDGVREGWLVPVGQKLEIVQDIDYSTIKLDKSGEFTEEDLARVMREEKNLYALADAAIKYSNYNGKQRSTLVFAASREHAIDVADILNAKHNERGTGRAACIHYKLDTDRRREIIAAYKRQEIRYLTNFGILCLDDQTEILTERGWLGIDDMRPDDRVANYEHVGEKAGTIFFAEPKAIVRRDRFPDERMVSVDGRRGNIRVTADHRMLFRKPRSTDAFGIVHAADCVNREGDVPVCGYAEPVPFWPVQPEAPADRKRLIAANSYHLRKAGMSYADARAEAERRLDARLARQYATADELSLSDCRFIGFYLAEGTRGNVAGGVEYTICQSVKNPHVVAFFDGVVAAMGIHHRRTERNGVVRWSFDRGTGADSKGGIFHLEPWLNKDGSNLFWSLTRAQWGAFIEGFWFGDGDHGQQSHMPQRFRLFNTNKSLIDWIQAVSVCRGCRATIGRAVGNVTDEHVARGHKPLYKLSMAWDVSTRGMSEQRLQFEAYWTPERVWCVTSHTGNIITRRGGIVTITGNTEGFDDDETRIIVNGRPIHKNRALFAQLVGRATRPLKEILAALAAAPDAAARKAIIKASRKPGAMVIDLCGVNHKLVLNMTDLLGGHYTEEAVSIVRDRIAKSNTVVDVETELEAIQRKIDEQKAEERRKRLRESVSMDVKLIGRDVDPFNLADGVAPRNLSNPLSNAATKPQLEMLERYGVPKNEIKELTKSAARKLIDTIQVRRRMGLCTYKQANKLAQYGYDPNMTFDDARKILDALAANGWRPIDLDRTNPNL